MLKQPNYERLLKTKTAEEVGKLVATDSEDGCYVLTDAIPTHIQLDLFVRAL